MVKDHKAQAKPTERETDLERQISELKRLRTDLQSEVASLRARSGPGESVRSGAIAEMAGRSAHHFSNLLQVVMAGAHLALTNLEMGNLVAAKSNLEQVLETSRYGAETVRYLQDFANVPRGGSTRGGKIFDLSRTVDQAIEMSKALPTAIPDDKEPVLSIQRAFEPGCLVKGKENEIFEAVSHLIKNAAAALPNGGEIVVATFVQDDSVVLRVKDNGIGIPKENLARVFEPFWTTKGFKGSGMGLTISFGVLRRHDGDIFLESREGEGTTVTATLPLAHRTIEETEAVAGKESRESLTVLVIDDIRPVMWVLRDELTKLGQTVVAASNGREGLEIFRSVKVDAVICDLGMPEMNGWDVARKVKAICEDWGVPKTPFVLLTGWGGQFDEAEKIRQCGVDRIAEKPADVQALLEIVRELVPAKAHDDEERLP